MNKKKPSILYISSYSNLSAERANVTNVVYMCDAFMGKCKDVRLVVFVPWTKLFASNGLLKQIDPELNIRILPIPYFKISGIYTLFDLISLFYGCLFSILGFEIYTRNCRFARLFYNIRRRIYVELHDFSEETQRCLKKCELATYFPISKGLLADIKKHFPNLSLTELPDAAKLTKPTPVEVNSRRPLIVYIGSDNEGKGVDFIFKLAKEAVDYHFLLVGPRKRSKNIKNIEYFGYADKSQVSALMEKADVLIAPYMFNVYDNAGNDISHYMSPLKIFEYMASKTPFICSELPFLKSFLLNNKHCLMAEAENIASWKTKIELLLSDKVLSSQLADNAFHLYKQNYTWDKRAQTVNQFLG